MSRQCWSGWVPQAGTLHSIPGGDVEVEVSPVRVHDAELVNPGLDVVAADQELAAVGGPYRLEQPEPVMGASEARRPLPSGWTAMTAASVLGGDVEGDPGAVGDQSVFQVRERRDDLSQVRVVGVDDVDRFQLEALGVNTGDSSPRIRCRSNGRGISDRELFRRHRFASFRPNKS